MSAQVTQLYPLMQARFFRTYASVIRIEDGAQLQGAFLAKVQLQGCVDIWNIFVTVCQSYVNGANTE